ncbi:unnamed protein product, partial [Choristocarpus tenellus]
FFVVAIAFRHRSNQEFDQSQFNRRWLRGHKVCFVCDPQVPVSRVVERQKRNQHLVLRKRFWFQVTVLDGTLRRGRLGGTQQDRNYLLISRRVSHDMRTSELVTPLL